MSEWLLFDPNTIQSRGIDDHSTVTMFLHLNFSGRVVIDYANPNEVALLLTKFWSSIYESSQIQFFLSTSNVPLPLDVVNRCPSRNLSTAISWWWSPTLDEIEPGWLPQEGTRNHVGLYPIIEIGKNHGHGSNWGWTRTMRPWRGRAYAQWGGREWYHHSLQTCSFPLAKVEDLFMRVFLGSPKIWLTGGDESNKWQRGHCWPSELMNR